MSADARPLPRAQGTLEKRPLAHLLAYCFERKLSGSLVFGDVDAPQAVVVLKEGEPSKASVTGDGDTWELLADMPAATAFAFFEEFDAIKTEPRADVHALDAILRVLRRNPPSEHMRATLQRIAGTRIVLDLSVPIETIALGAPARDALQRVLSQLGASGLTIEMLASEPALRTQYEVIVYGLLITKVAQAAVTTPAEEPSSSSRMAAAPPSSSDAVDSAAVGRMKLTRASQKLTPLTEAPTVISSYDDRASVPPPQRMSPSPEMLARKKEILDRAKQIDSLDYFEMLGVSQDTPPAQIQAIFLTLAKRWHPDRLPPELADVRDACNRVFSRFSEAAATLGNEEQRTKYMRLLKEGGATPEDQEKIASVVEAATSFQKAEVMLKRGDLAKAEEFCALAVRLDAQPDYVSMLAWVQSQKPENQSKEATERFEATLSGAIQANERCERAYFYRGALRKRLGRVEDAVNDFRQAFFLNPRNLDAQREVRVFEMRREKSSLPPPPPEKKPSFIGKLFKK